MTQILGVLRWSSIEMIQQGDADARIGTVRSDAIGTEEAQAEDAGGSCLFALSLEMGKAPHATFVGGDHLEMHPGRPQSCGSRVVRAEARDYVFLIAHGEVDH